MSQRHTIYNHRVPEKKNMEEEREKEEPQEGK